MLDNQFESVVCNEEGPSESELSIVRGWRMLYVGVRSQLWRKTQRWSRSTLRSSTPPPAKRWCYSATQRAGWTPPPHAPCIGRNWETKWLGASWSKVLTLEPRSRPISCAKVRSRSSRHAVSWRSWFVRSSRWVVCVALEIQIQILHVINNVKTMLCSSPFCHQKKTLNT